LKSGRWSAEEVNALFRIKTTLDACAVYRPACCAMGMLDLLRDDFVELQKAVFMQESQDKNADSVEARTALFAHVATIEVFLDEEANLDGKKTEHQVALCQELRNVCGFLAAATPMEPRAAH